MKWEESTGFFDDRKRDIIFTNDDKNGESWLVHIVKLDQNLTIVLKHWRQAFNKCFLYSKFHSSE